MLGGTPRYLGLELLDGFLERERLEKGHIWGRRVLVEFQVWFGTLWYILRLTTQIPL